MKLINEIVYRFVLVLCKIIAFVLYPNKVHGKVNLDIEGPYILYCNHISAMDPIIIVGSVLTRKSYFMGKESLFKGWFLKWFCGAIGGFPVKRGTADMQAIKIAINHLSDGDILTLYPEGTRNTNSDGTLLEFHNGLGIIALRAICKIVPCYVDSLGGYKLFKRYNITIGKSIDLDDFKKDGLRKENLNKLMKLAREKMEELMPMY